MTADNLQSLRYTNDNGALELSVLDQLKVPHEKVYIPVTSVEDAFSVIRNMQIRGAPLIAIVAVLGLAVDLNANTETIAELDNIDNTDGDAVMAFIQTKMDYLSTARPTAVNVFNALQELKGILEDVKESENARQEMCNAICKHAEFMLERDVSDNKAIGAFGAQAILKDTGGKKARVVTICNTGSLATAGYGTALGVARALQEQDKLESITALETRPYNQGSRLTAFEILEENMPGGQLICDSMAGSLMRTKGVDACVVGADRVCANGDTANKIGTYNLALVATAHGVPFYVASPFTTLDTSLKTGDDIKIEERPAEELLKTSAAPPNMPCWNPAFDVTPAKYITGIITEKGIIEPSADGTFDVPGFVSRFAQTSFDTEVNGSPEETTAKLQIPSDYIEQSIQSLPAFLAKNAPKAMKVLGTNVSDDLECVEMGDGNLNLVFIVTNKVNQYKIIVKQALPYVRCVGEGWPLTLERAQFEFQALCEEKKACPEFVPNLYYFSRSHALMVMEYIAPPNIILRKGLVQGIRYPSVASDLGKFCAKTLFKTSGFKLSETELRKNVQFWERNSEMCALTEQVVFTEPYIQTLNNRWTSPQLDTDKKAIESDIELKIAACKWKLKFVTTSQALIHGDLHSGSVMCCAHQTFVIDPEFAFYGPMGFDTGAFVANLFLAYVSQAGHDNDESYADWILEQIIIFWTTFETEFIKLWNDPSEHIGMAFSRRLLSADVHATKLAQDDFIKSLFTDTIGFAGMKMLRRIVGIAHVEDLETIEDANVRAKCERHGLEIAKVFIKTAHEIGNIQDAVEIAKSKKV